MLHHGFRSVWRIGWLAPAQQIRRLRRENSISILEHPEEVEKQSNHLAEGSVNIVKGLVRTLKSSAGSNLKTEIVPSHPLIPRFKERAAQLKNRRMVGADGTTPTERLRGRGVQCLLCELGEKVLFLPLARRGDFGARFDCGVYLGFRSFDSQAYIGTPSGVIRCRTVRQLCAGERWDTEFVLSIKGTPWSPVGGRAGEVNIRVDLSELEVTGVRIRQILAHQSSSGEDPTREMFERFWFRDPFFWVAVPFRELGTLQTTLSAVAKRLSKKSRKSLREPPRSLATERPSSEPDTTSEPET